MRRVALFAAMAALTVAPVAAQRSSNPLVDLWSQGKPAFGVFVPNEAPRPAGGPGGQGAPRTPSTTGAAGATGAPSAAGAQGAAGAAGAQRQRPKPVYTEAGG